MKDLIAKKTVGPVQKRVQNADRSLAELRSSVRGDTFEAVKMLPQNLQMDVARCNFANDVHFRNKSAKYCFTPTHSRQPLMRAKTLAKCHNRMG